MLSRDPRDDVRALVRLGVSNRRLKSPIALADGKTRSLRSRISGGTKWLGLRSKSKSPKFGSDRKQFFPDDAVARPHP